MEQTTSIEQKDSIKLIKGQKNSYGWEIKIYIEESENQRKSDETGLTRLDNFNSELKKRYGDVKWKKIFADSAGNHLILNTIKAMSV